MRLRVLQLLLLGLLIVAWYVMTAPGLIPPFYFDKAAEGLLGDRRLVRER